MSKRVVDIAALRARMEQRFPQPVPKKSGRPKGSKNRIEVPTEAVKHAAIEHADPSTLIERQLVIAEWMQSAFRAEIQRRMEEPRIVIDSDDVKRFEGLTLSLDRAVNTLKKSMDVAEELASRLTADQLLDATLKKIEAQEPAFVRYAIKRLKAHLDRVAPRVEPLGTAVEAMASLEDE